MPSSKTEIKPPAKPPVKPPAERVTHTKAETKQEVVETKAAEEILPKVKPLSKMTDMEMNGRLKVIEGNIRSLGEEMRGKTHIESEKLRIEHSRLLVERIHIEDEIKSRQMAVALQGKKAKGTPKATKPAPEAKQAVKLAEAEKRMAAALLMKDQVEKLKREIAAKVKSMRERGGVTRDDVSRINSEIGRVNAQYALTITSIRTEAKKIATLGGQKPATLTILEENRYVQ